MERDGRRWTHGRQVVVEARTEIYVPITFCFTLSLRERAVRAHAAPLLLLGQFFILSARPLFPPKRQLFLTSLYTSKCSNTNQNTWQRGLLIISSAQINQRKTTFQQSPTARRVIIFPKLWQHNGSDGFGFASRHFFSSGPVYKNNIIRHL